MALAQDMHGTIQISRVWQPFMTMLVKQWWANTQLSNTAHHARFDQPDVNHYLALHN